jgi:hypothetical protein
MPHFTLHVAPAGPIVHAFVGRDILGACVFHYNGAVGTFTLAF